MEFETIIYGKDGGVATVTFNRPAQLNALNIRMIEELVAAFSDVAADDRVRVLVVTGNEKAFGAGADLKMIHGLATTASAHAFFTGLQGEPYRRLSGVGKPTIAAVAGIALGGMCELALACDLRIAAENATFGLPEIKLGLLPGGGGTQRLPRLVGATKAKEMLLTGDSIDAQEAYRIGLVNKVVPLEKLMEETNSLAQKLAARPPFALQMINTAVNTGLDLSLDAALAYEGRCFEMLFSTEDMKEGVQAFIEKRKPAYTGR
ncbi:MAG: enoyl-CoA hydratase/isomerase family protein [Deltaproteobacteria bacterium]|nr:enoyl-CoA hydratase/isomerase family protein [Deltaproteobacteria bacterium]